MQKQTRYRYVVRRHGIYINTLPFDNKAIERFIRNNVTPLSALETWTDDLGETHYGVKNFDSHLPFTELLAEAGKQGYTFDPQKTDND